MSPTYLRFVFVGFTLLIAGVTANVAFLQPELPANGSGRTASNGTVEVRSEVERRQRLALERQPAASAQVALAAAVPAKVEPPKLASSGFSDQSAVPSRVTAGGLTPRPSIQAQVPLAMEPGVRRFARLRPDAALADRPGDRLPDAPDAEGDPETIKAVQRELSTRGYGQLNQDGVPGLVTRAAIMAYEYDNRLVLTGEATERLLARLLLGPTGVVSDAPDPRAGQVRTAQAELVMRTVQQSLAALGYQTGKIDGKAGDEIARAIREFELDEGLKPTGRVSAEVFSRLGRVVASAKPKPVQ